MNIFSPFYTRDVGKGVSKTEQLFVVPKTLSDNMVASINFLCTFVYEHNRNIINKQMTLINIYIN